MTVAKCTKSDKADADEDGYEVDYEHTFITRTHLGHLLHTGDYARGYHLHSTNFNSELFDELANTSSRSSSLAEIPDVVLVKKFYPSRRKTRGKRGRHWKLERLDNTEVDEDMRRQLAKRGEQERREAEWEGFIEEIEEDKELRGMINLYRGMVMMDEVGLCAP